MSEWEEKLRKAEAEKKKREEEQSKLEQLSTTPASKIEFSESMSPTDLAEWLLEEIGSDFKDDINKLKSIILRH